MTAMRWMDNKWILTLGALAAMALWAGPAMADHPGGGHSGPPHAWSRGPDHHAMPFHHGGYSSAPYYHNSRPIYVAPPVYCQPREYVPVYGGFRLGGGGITIIIR
jgi:hypothetical protein